MSERGEYRAIRRVLLDGPDFQQLPERARWIFIALKINLGPSGIEVHYPDALVVQLAAQTGATANQVRASLDVLEQRGWIAREANLIWVLEQLEHDPHVKVGDIKHRKSIQRHIAGLPHLAIVESFRTRYPEWFADDVSTPPKAVSRPSEGPSMGLLKTESPPSKHKPENKPEPEKEKHARAKKPRVRSDKPRETWLTPASLAWERVFGPGSFDFGKASKPLARLKDAGLSPDEIGHRVGRYCAARKGGFCNYADFAEHHAEWASPPPEALVRDGWFTHELERETRPAGLRESPYGPLPSGGAA